MNNYELLMKEVNDQIIECDNENEKEMRNKFYKNIYSNFHHEDDTLNIVKEIQKNFIDYGEQYGFDYIAFENDCFEKLILNDMDEKSKIRLKQRLIQIDLQLELHRFNSYEANLAIKEAKDNYKKETKRPCDKVKVQALTL